MAFRAVAPQPAGVLRSGALLAIVLMCTVWAVVAVARGYRYTGRAFDAAVLVGLLLSGWLAVAVVIAVVWRIVT